MSRIAWSRNRASASRCSGDRFRNEPVADWELEKARRGFLHSEVQQAQRTLSRAIMIGEFAVFYNEPELINTMQEKIDAVTKEDIQRVAKTYLTEANRTVVTTLPKPKAESAQKGAN